MGYAKPNQDAGGIHLRQFSRALIVEDRLGSRVMYINLDNGMISQLLRTRVLGRLKSDYGEHYFNESNVMLSATHTHSGPGGFFQYMLYNIPSAGFISQTLEALTEGIVRSVGRAHAALQPGRMYVARGQLLEASVNRSPTSYANNAPEERAKYQHDTDKDMWLLRLVDRRGQPLGLVNWFAVHGTSMNNTNHLISSDNKGYAALLMERDFNPAGTLPGRGKFVAMFAQANEGDVSPNTRGPRCVDTGLPCDQATSTCGNPPRNEKCIASGPGADMFQSTQIIAHKQYYMARQLFHDHAHQVQVRGPVRYVHEHIDITRQEVPAYEAAAGLYQRQLERERRRQLRHAQLLQPFAGARAGGARRQSALEELPAALLEPIVPHQVQRAAPIAPNATYRTCVAGLGHSFAAGTTDGPGAFDFQQGNTVATRYWNMVRDFLKRPSEDQVKCHHPKPILLSTGEMDFPYMWHPKIVPTQIIMVGQVALVGLPGEFTTMSGRRVRDAVSQALEQNRAKEPALDFTSFGQLHPGAGPTNELDDDDDDDDNEPADDDDADRLTERPANASTSAQLAGLVEVRSKRARQSAAAAKPRARSASPAKLEVILSGLSNIYTSYITTIEEYEIQRYEGASTLYGPHTLQAYVNQFKRLAGFLVPGASGRVPLDDSLQPPDLTKSLFTLKAGVIYDGAPHGKNFGDPLSELPTNRSFWCGEQVSVAFVAGNPRNDLKQEQSFLYVDKFEPATRSWSAVASDASWETKFIWERTNTLFGESKATVQWDLPDDCEPGVYRIRHLGAHKSLLQTISNYEGKSSAFKVAGKRAAAPFADLAADSTAKNNGKNNNNNEPKLEEQLEAWLELAQQTELANEQLELQRLVGGSSQAKSDKPDLMRQATGSPKSAPSIWGAPLRFLGALTRWHW